MCDIHLYKCLCSGSVIAQVVGWEKLDPSTKANAITMGDYTQCHPNVGPALRGD
jgi:hypothetical protein